MVLPKIVPIDPLNPDPAIIEQAAKIIRAGGLVVFPTETVYGLGGNALNTAAVESIFRCKGRPSSNPLIVHIEDRSQVGLVARRWSLLAEKLASIFWPGPLTLILPRTARVPTLVTGGGDTVAVRCPIHPVAQALLKASGVPIAAPSANSSTELSPTTAAHVMRSLKEGFDLLLDGGPTPGGLESTVLDINCDPPRLLRPGLISPTEISDHIGPIERMDILQNRVAEAVYRSPGMMQRHYAPRTPLLLVAHNTEAMNLIDEWRAQGRRIGWLSWGEAQDHESASVLTVRMPTEVSAYSIRLYAELHDLDASGVEVIVVTVPPDQEPWLAVRDRLHRAATPAEPLD